MATDRHDLFQSLVESAVIRGGIVNLDLTVDEFNDYEHRLGELLRRFPGHTILLAHLDGVDDLDQTAVVIDLPTPQLDEENVAPMMFLIPTDQVEQALKTIALVASQIGSG